MLWPVNGRDTSEGSQTLVKVGRDELPAAGSGWHGNVRRRHRWSGMDVQLTAGVDALCVNDVPEALASLSPSPARP
jgi:hypothetical protein